MITTTITTTTTIIITSNWTKWSTIQGIVKCIISKLDECVVQGQFKIMNMITP